MEREYYLTDKQVNRSIDKLSEAGIFPKQRKKMFVSYEITNDAFPTEKITLLLTNKEHLENQEKNMWLFTPLENPDHFNNVESVIGDLIEIPLSKMRQI